jgi:type IV pilus assembly protein PilE
MEHFHSIGGHRLKTMNMPRNRLQHSGFTLMELMIAVAIVAILVSIALPAYQSQVKRSKRVAAQGDMMDIANREQRFLLANRAYATKATLESSGFSLDANVATVYTYTVAVGTGATPTFLITFTATGNQVSEGDMELNEQGKGTPADKWER